MRQVAVDTDCQQSGIGKLLVFFSEQYAKNNGFHTIELHARDAAKDFYLKQNYIVEGDVFTEVGIPHYKMKKKLE
jgi:predicted GNAT family N-acyltransferase